MPTTNITATLKAKLDELDLDRRLNEVVDSAEQGFKKALDQAAGYTSTRREDIERLLESASEKINAKTDGKYAGHVTKVRDQVSAGVARLADRAASEAPAGTNPADDTSDTDVDGDTTV